MELIKRNDLKLIFTNYIGEAKDDKDNLICECRTTQHYDPIIVFPDGDMVIISWTDIYNIAKEYKDKCYEEVKNESI